MSIKKLSKSQDFDFRTISSATITPMSNYNYNFN